MTIVRDSFWQADDTTGPPPVTFGLHGKGIRINDMRVGGDGVALACEAIAQVCVPLFLYPSYLVFLKVISGLTAILPWHARTRATSNAKLLRRGSGPLGCANKQRTRMPTLRR
jgi:hypothetical protein